jgi:hypothetical protein
MKNLAPRIMTGGLAARPSRSQRVLPAAENLEQIDCGCDVGSGPSTQALLVVAIFTFDAPDVIDLSPSLARA